MKQSRDSYEQHYEREVARQLSISKDLVSFKARTDITDPPIMICSVSGQDGYDTVFSWDEVLGLSTRTAVVPKIGVFQSVHEAQALLIVMLKKGCWPDPIEVISKSRT